MTCSECRRPLTDEARFCSHCGTEVTASATADADPQQAVDSRQTPAPATEDLNLSILYTMAAALVLAVLVPPWEAPPSDPPAFLGLHPFWTPPTPTALVSRMLLTIETMTIAIAGFYASWLFRGPSKKP